MMLFDLLGDFRLGYGHRNLLDAGNLSPATW